MVHINDLKIKVKETLDIPYVYAANYLTVGGRQLGILASEGREGKCVLLDGARRETVWDGPGGTMTICQNAPSGSFYAVQQFFPVFDSKEACIVSAKKEADGWNVRKVLDAPYVHRFDYVDTADGRYLLIGQLTRGKKERTDWSQPGSLYAVRLDDEDRPQGEPIVMIDTLFKNHGYFRGTLNGQEVCLVTGVEGMYKVCIDLSCSPDRWAIECLVDREISDSYVYDFDGDGVDEIVTIEGFHGDNLNIYKQNADGKWEQVWNYGIHFGHALWAGDIFGDAAIIIGYRREDCALKLLRKKAGVWAFEETVMCTEYGPTNIAVRKLPDGYEVLCAGRTLDKGLVFEIK